MAQAEQHKENTISKFEYCLGNILDNMKHKTSASWEYQKEKKISKGSRKYLKE